MSGWSAIKLFMGAMTMTLLFSNIVDSQGETKKGITIYVSPDGNDKWSGRLPAPNRRKTDGPFATLKRALDEVKNLKAAFGGILLRPVTIQLRGGLYFLNEPVLITPEHSGNEQHKLTICAYGNEKPILSGGRRITGWRKLSASQLPEQLKGKPIEVWAAQIPEVKEGKWFFRQLWINGRRARRARHPNNGYLKVAEVVDKTQNWFIGQKRFRFVEGDIKAWSTANDAEVVVMNRWVESRLPIAEVDEAQRIVSFQKRSVFQLDVGDPYYVEHAIELLDEPGEWFLDKRSGMLYYIPRDDEDMRNADVIAPSLIHVLRAIGEPKAGLFVEHITLRGITFSHTEWYFPEASKRGSDVGGFAQAAVEVPGAVYFEGARYCSIEECAVAHIGNYGVEFARGCHNNSLKTCVICDIGAGGVKIGETRIREDKAEQTFGNEIYNCTIRDGGLMFHSAVGIWVGQSYNNRIAHNEIADFYYTGISIGWTWGYGNSLAGGNAVEFNHVHHIGKRTNGDGPILSDMGAIYTLGIQHGTVIRNNLFHDIYGLRYGGWGIYFDEGSTGIVAERNIVYNTTHGGFHQHYGRENIVRNNIFAYARDHQLQVTRPEGHLRFRFERNIVIGKGERWLVGGIDFNFAFERNLYWREDGGEIRFGNLTWKQWQDKGMDKDSIIADPMFVDAAKYNFKLREQSPALKLGFEPIDLSEVGPRGTTK
ncbi:MAG: right-handed parallel beta-helix repeat-containing protein [Armatimonadota bacterium]|nr:right-handed parallel beta-helix repeat-containing protein [Armatimonadota bacterium]MCX7776443.1 right-handed parallel beta-helix repeat-containing protein [Armatimonadota bacterium]MDW8024241.1 right-handed parallel beta-helix repeat-containing protein [Armatimonadota bacterium]